MLPSPACLQDFVTSVPICLDTADLKTVLESLVLESLQSVGDNSLPTVFYGHLVLVDSQHQPVGFVSLHRLMPHVLRLEAVGGVTLAQILAPLDAGEAKPQEQSNTSRFDCSLQALPPEVIEPITVLSGGMPLDRFLLHFQLQDQIHYVITGHGGKYLGLLDRSRLLEYLVLHQINSVNTGEKSSTSEEPAKVEPAKVEPAKVRQQQALKRQQQSTQLTQQILAQKEMLEMKVRAQQELIQQLQANQGMVQATGAIAASPLSGSSSLGSLLPEVLLNPLLELIEYLPLPLMLQTNSGRVLAQNSVWAKLAGELLDPNWVRLEASAVLELPITDQSVDQAKLQPRGYANAPVGALEPPQSYAATMQASFLSSPGQAEVEPAAVDGPLCRLGSKPGTCVCSCTLKNGQEQVLQFIKIPLGFLSVVTPNRVAAPTQGGMDASTHPSAANPDDSSETLCLILAQDITEQHHLARELTAKNADLVQLNRLKDEFLACISHELRTPLTAVLGLSSLLKDQTLGEMTQRQVHYAQLIYQSGRQLMAVVNDILDLTRMETGQLELFLAPVGIDTVCQRAFEQATQARLLDDRQASPTEPLEMPQFSLEIEPGLDTLIADEQRLRQMLVHLLSNGLKFTPSDAQMGLKVNRWGGWIAFTVWDTGIGIPADKQHLIFQKFQQLENPLTRQFEGTGLGLVLTQRLARLHGGDVTFISKEGQGSQFTILLPPSPPDKNTLTTDEEEANPPLPSGYPGGRVPLQNPNHLTSKTEWSGRKMATLSDVSCQEGTCRSGAAGSKSGAACNRLLLIVEAVPQSIEFLSSQLTGLGYRVVVARSGTEALEKARRLQPCIIFLNPVLPLLSGWDVLTLLKSNPETQQIPVVMTATKVEDAQPHSQADGWLSLPVQAKALRQILRELVVEPKRPELASQPASVLTVLCLNPGVLAGSHAIISATDLSQFLQFRHFRVLEADDLEQAEMLARVWKPNVVLLHSTLTDPIAYFQQFSQHPFLASLPLVTLDQAVTEAANQVLGLLVFPCLTSFSSDKTVGEENETTATLLQVIQIAAGYAWRPSILALDMAMLPRSLDTANPLTSSEQNLGSLPKTGEWLQALTQYLQTAGLRGLVGRSWEEVLHQMRSQSVDLLLICLTESSPQPIAMEMLTALHQLENRPPILVLDHRYQAGSGEAEGDLPSVLQELAAQILPPTLPMTDLLEQIYQVLKRTEE